MIDSGLYSTFISERLQKKLGLPMVRMGRVSSLNGCSTGTVQGQCSFVLTSLLDDRLRVKSKGLVLPKLTGNLSNSSVDISRTAVFSGVSLADKGGHIDILIGGDVYPDILLEGLRRNILGKLMAQEGIFGWIVTVPLPELNLKRLSNYMSDYAKIVVSGKFEEV